MIGLSYCSMRYARDYSGFQGSSLSYRGSIEAEPLTDPTGMVIGDGVVLGGPLSPAAWQALRRRVLKSFPKRSKNGAGLHLRIWGIPMV